MRTRHWHARWSRRVGLVLLALVCPAAAPDAASPSPAAPAGYHLVWHDEFDGTEVDRTKWDFDTGTGFYIPASKDHPGTWVNGWGNDELECYTDRHANAYVADGFLHLRAVKEDYKGGSYTSARLRTGGHGEQPLFTCRYGRVEFRAKLPTGQGYWPALWMLPQDEAYGGWAASGELDVMENRGSAPDVVQGTLHFGAASPKNVWAGQQHRLANGGTVADWHVYAVDWEPGRITWSVDGVAYFTRNFWSSRTGADANAWPAPFDKPFYILINLAIGGRFGGNPTSATAFPQEMLVDYVRVYQRDGGPGEVHPRGPGREGGPSVVGKPE
jgi:beta-glucanase (GH16 family)